MRDETPRLRHHERRRRRDDGVGLLEVLISITVLGLVCVVVATSISVVLRSSKASESRLNVTSDMRTLTFWLPPDLTSAQDVDVSPGASPCGSSCPSNVQIAGSNVLMVSWTGKEAGQTTALDSRTVVSYRYVNGGNRNFQLVRIECTTVGSSAPTCDSHVVGNHLEAPPAGSGWTPGVTSPTWAISVALPADASTGGTSSPAVGQRVVVTVNGGGSSPGAGGGANTMTFTAGTSAYGSLDPDSAWNVPTFGAARSRCGGRITLVVDESGSIGSSITQVRAGVLGFIDAFAGTPVQLQIVRFASRSSVLGSSGWSQYYDMLDSTQVSTLRGLVGNLTSSGGTNWEDALFRTFFNEDGSVPTALPDLVLFFTDGVPTASRLDWQASSSAPLDPPGRTTYPVPSGWYPGGGFNQESWYRADYIAAQFRSTVRMIGVGVGADITKTSQWYEPPQTRTLYERSSSVVFERNANLKFERGNKVVWERGNKLAFERGYHLDSRNKKTYTAPYTGWDSTSESNYTSSNKVPGETDGWRARVTGDSTAWSTVSMDDYEASNTTPDAADGWRTRQTSASTSWTSVAEDVFLRYDTTLDATDGWRTSLSSLAGSWTAVSETAFRRYNTVAGTADGWRTRHGGGAGTTWSEVTSLEYSSTNATNDETDGYRTRTVTTTETFQAQNSSILARVISGNEHGVPATLVNGVYTNPSTADLYVLPDWDQFELALRAVALSQCGGTLTLQTKVGEDPAGDPFTYQNTAVTDSSGAPVDIALTTVTTRPETPSGTFDFPIEGADYVTVEIQPQLLSSLSAYTPVGWSCRAGVTNRDVTTFHVGSGQWTGIRVRVAANEAVSCTLAVNRVTG